MFIINTFKTFRFNHKNNKLNLILKFEKNPKNKSKEK